MLRKDTSDTGTGFSTADFTHFPNSDPGLTPCVPEAMVTPVIPSPGKQYRRYLKPSTWKIKIFKTWYGAEICIHHLMTISVLQEGNSHMIFWIIKIAINPFREYSSGSALRQPQSASLPPSVPQTSHKPLHLQPDKTRKQEETQVTVLTLCGGVIWQEEEESTAQ